MKHVVFYSGGLGSWATAKRVIDRHGAEDTICLFTDTLIEDADLYRFLLETTQEMYGIDQSDLIERTKYIPETSHEMMESRKSYLKQLSEDTNERNSNFVWLNDGRDPWDVFKDVRFLGNSRLANCSHELKQKMSAKWIKEHFAPDECTLYLGIDWTEEHRTKAPRKNWAPYQVEYPMCEEPLWTKIDVAKELEATGIKRPILYEQGFSHNNCFAGKEKFITDEGLKTFGEVVGKKVKVLGRRGGWKDAEIKSFGKQLITKLHLKRYKETKVIETTSDHRWFKRKGRKGREVVYTKDLKLGDKLLNNYGKRSINTPISEIGVMHGFTFGDGSRSTPKESPARTVLCGDKTEMLKWFPGSNVRKIEGIGVEVCNLPRKFKDLPDAEECNSYLYSFLSGYFAADGSVSSGQIKLSSKCKSDLEVIKNIATRLKIGTNEIRSYERYGYNDFKTPLYSITFVASTLDDSFFLRELHKKKFSESSAKRSAEWSVVKVEHTDRLESVFCAVVPDGHEFTLESNIRTLNCGGFCVRAGQGHFANLWQTKPKLYRYHEEKEKEMQEFLNRPVTILKRTRSGEKQNLSLKKLRHELEQGGEQVDMFDIGGCGCFVEDGAK